LYEFFDGPLGQVFWKQASIDEEVEKRKRRAFSFFEEQFRLFWQKNSKEEVCEFFNFWVIDLFATGINRWNA
jgi:hypothetical protein